MSGRVRPKPNKPNKSQDENTPPHMPPSACRSLVHLDMYQVSLTATPSIYSITAVYRFLTCDAYHSTTKPGLTKLARPLSRACVEPALNVLVTPACPDSPLKKLAVSSKWWEVPPGEMKPVAFRFTIFLRKAWFDSVRFGPIPFGQLVFNFGNIHIQGEEEGTALGGGWVIMNMG